MLAVSVLALAGPSLSVPALAQPASMAEFATLRLHFLSDGLGTNVSQVASRRVGPSIAAHIPSGRTDGPKVDISHPYVITLKSLLKPHDPATLPDLPTFKKYRLYTTKFIKDGKVWHRLRLGFFPTKEAARKVAKSLKDTYPQAWVSRARGKERLQSAALAVSPGRRRQGDAPSPSTPSTATLPRQIVPARPSAQRGKPAAKISDNRLALVMEQAEQAMTAGDHARAIRLYTAVLQQPESAFVPKAQELIGLARERKGQFAQAKAAYEEYLHRYPRGEGAERVGQRLAGLVTARARPPKKRSKGKSIVADRPWRYDFYGSLSQFYTRKETISDVQAGVEATKQSDLSANVDLNGRMRNDDYELSAQFIGGHLASFIGQPSNHYRVNTLLVDAVDRQNDLSARIGRQSGSSGGVLGRFDGGLAGYQITPKVRLHGVGGFPVTSSRSLSTDDEKYFYGLNLDLGTFADSWDFNLFAINQVADGITDRRAVGGEVRFFHPSGSFFTLIDYDVMFNELNTALFSGNWLFPDRTTVTFGLDYRKAPILTTSNALQGQGAVSLGQLKSNNSFDEEQLRNLAKDRTATSRSVSLGVSRPLNERIQIGADITVSHLSDTVASAGVPATPGTGYEYFYSAQLIGSGLFAERDIAILGLRYADASTSDTVSLTLNTRFPISSVWQINPRFRTDYRWNENGSGHRLSARPSIRTEYLIPEWDVRLELEAGFELVDEYQFGQSRSSIDSFVTVGYRIDF